MKKIILMCIFCTVLLFALPWKGVTAQDVLPLEIKHPTTPLEIMEHFADQYGLSATKLAQFKKVRMCESKGNPNAHNKSDPNGGSFSELQFQKATFLTYSKKAGIEKPDIKNRTHVLETGIYMFSIGQANQWTTYRALVNGGTYSFYFKHQQKWVTIRCA